MDEISALEIAQLLSGKLSAALDDFNAESVRLTRDEAVLALGIINSVVEMLEKEGAKPN
ncbi:hypothetical protein [Sphingobium sp. TB-6]|uniref:hypothetical protein n=1 Tax=Sphingobium sp. TB-6 TaxID=2728850 RepID=UPI001F0EBF17|nr:hypothetical protein [Sphingobium sp. TB-6]